MSQTPRPGHDRRQDAALREVRLAGVAAHWATESGDTKDAACTVNAYATPGPNSRIDRIYVSAQLLAALTAAAVPVPETPGPAGLGA